MQAVDTTTLKVGIKERWTPTDVITTPGDATKAGKTATAANYDSQGRYQGKQDVRGRYYDSQGRYQGRRDANGRYYDSQGRYQGRDK